MPDADLRRLPPRWRLMAVMPLAVFAVHQLRYYLAFGPRADRELADQGHAYLTSLAPWIVMLAALGFGAFALRLARAWSGGRIDAPARRHSALRLWGVTAAGLLAIYVGQELFEGFMATGHPGGLLGLFGDGGWGAVPAAMVVGGIVTLGLRGARAVMAFVARRRTPSRLPPVPRPSASHPRVDLFPADPLAGCAAGRAPPLAGLIGP